MTQATEKHAAQLRALGHPARLAIVRYVVQDGVDGTVAGEIQQALGIPASTLSHHLEKLCASGLITARREGTFIYYAAHIEALKKLTEYIWENCCARGGKSRC